MLKYALLLLATSFNGSHCQQPCLNAPQNPHSFAASPEGCNEYILCMNKQTVRGLRCPAGLLFEPLSQICGSSTCMDCSPFDIQNLPHPKNCDMFIECIMGHQTIRTCPNDLRFDRRLGHCTNPEHAECEDDPSITTETPTTEPPSNEPACFTGERFHVHPSDCTRFFICIDWFKSNYCLSLDANILAYILK